MLAPSPNYVDLSKPTIEGLIYLLRHKELWPENFVWHFPSCRSCAMGLFAEEWGRIGQRHLTRVQIQNILGLPFDVAVDAFCVHDRVGNKCYPSVADADVTPEMVALKLEKYLPPGFQPGFVEEKE